MSRSTNWDCQCWGRVGSGSARNPKSPKTRSFRASPLAREPAGWDHSRPDPNPFFFRATSQQISVKNTLFLRKCGLLTCFSDGLGTRNTQPMSPPKEKLHFFTSTNFRHHFFRLYFLGLGRAQPETRKTRKPDVSG